MECALRINVYRNYSDGITSDTNQEIPDTNQEIPDTKIGVNKESEDRLFAIIQKFPDKSQKEYAEILNASLSTTKRLFVRLQEDGLIYRSGTNRKGRWMIGDVVLKEDKKF